MAVHHRLVFVNWYTARFTQNKSQCPHTAYKALQDLHPPSRDTFLIVSWLFFIAIVNLPQALCTFCSLHLQCPFLPPAPLVLIIISHMHSKFISCLSQHLTYVRDQKLCLQRQDFVVMFITMASAFAIVPRIFLSRKWWKLSFCPIWCLPLSPGTFLGAEVGKVATVRYYIWCSWFSIAPTT